MKWRIKHDQTGLYMPKDTFGNNVIPPQRNDTVGDFTKYRSLASVYDDNAKASYILPEGFSWEIAPRRYRDAIDVQNAVNPAGVAASLHEAMREVIRENGDTQALKNDPACRMIFSALSYLMGGGSPYLTSEYQAMYEAVIDLDGRETRKP